MQASNSGMSSTARASSVARLPHLADFTTLPVNAPLDTSARPPFTSLLAGPESPSQPAEQCCSSTGVLACYLLMLPTQEINSYALNWGHANHQGEG